MSQLSPNLINHSLVTDPENTRKKGFFRNSESRPKNQICFTRPCSIPKQQGNEDNVSMGVGTVAESSRMHKLGNLPSYLKKQTKSTVESELFTKYKKFKMAKRDLVQHQSNLKKSYEQLQVLKEKFKQFGGRDFKMETLELIEFIGGGVNDNGGGDGDHRIGSGNCADNKVDDFVQEIQRIQNRVKDCFFKFIEFNSEIFKQIQESGTEELQNKSYTIVRKIEEYVKSLTNEHDMNTQFLLENFQQLKIPFLQDTHEIHSTNGAALKDEIVGLKEVIQNLEVQGKMLQSEIDVKNREIEYMIGKESCRESCINEGNKDELQSEILAQKAIIDDYSNKLDQHLRQNEIYEEQIRQLNDTVVQQNEQIQKNLSTYETDLSEQRKKCEELREMLNEAKNHEILQGKVDQGSNYEVVSNQLTTANEDVKELTFKICKREKQIQHLKQLLNTELNKVKAYDHLENCKSQEINQLKEKLAMRTDTINSQFLTISELKKMVMDQGTMAGDYSKDNNVVGPLQDEQTSKFAKQERIIEKLENNKIRSNVLRDQLLNRISMLENDNEDLKAQIRKFHEDFTINRFMYDEQRRKKRLTDILVKQYQK